jgi:hypothetical protein
MSGLDRYHTLLFSNFFMKGKAYCFGASHLKPVEPLREIPYPTNKD